MTLSDKLLKAHHDKLREERREIADGNALSIRISTRGRITFQYSYRIDGKPDRYDYGRYPEISLSEARELHLEARRLVDQGICPKRHFAEKRAAEQRARREAAEADTVNTLVGKFMQRYIRRERKRPDEIQRIFDVDVVPAIGEKRVTELTRRDVVRMLDKIVDRGSRIQANHVLALTKQCLQYGVERGVVERNVASDIRRKTVGGDEKPRNRVLSRAEIRALWLALDHFSEPVADATKPAPGRKVPEAARKTVYISKPTAAAIKLLLATAQRRGELMGARWNDVDLERRIWHLPETKNGSAHDVHLSDLAIEMFELLKAYAGGSAYVLPGVDPREAATERVLTKAAARLQGHVLIDNERAIPHWVIHDLRRTAASHMGEAPLSVMPHVIEKVLYHRLSGILGVYQHQALMNERRAALEAWGKELRTIVRGADVIALPAAG